MSIARLSRDSKRQLGQYLTPESTAAAIIESLRIPYDARVLEPSFGEGSFIFALLASVRRNLNNRQLSAWSATHLYGCEIDDAAYQQFEQRWRAEGLGDLPETLEHSDFFTWLPPGCDRTAATDRRRYFASRLEFFDLVLGNPPFGGSIAPSIQDELDAIFGMRNGRKVKKETYAFFIVKSLDLLKPGGQLVFICSDTILTIATMTGLRAWLQSSCDVELAQVPGTFSDTNQQMLLLKLTKQAGPSTHIAAFGKHIPLSEITATPNMSWRVNTDLARYFTGATVGQKMVATSGMTIGNNDLFLRALRNDQITEPYDFAFVEQPITVAREVARARLGKVPPERLRTVQELEARGATETAIAWTQLEAPRQIMLPHSDYCYYNKASSRIIYADPEWVIFWRDNGAYVYTYKKTGNWYLHGVGGMKFFGREGFTWSLIAPRFYARYLPSGYILDSGAPAAFTRPGVHRDELFFVLGWTLTDLCTRILKEVLNHTRNIQSKDFERLPYPVWVDAQTKQGAIHAVKEMIETGKAGQVFTFKSKELRALNAYYDWRDVGKTDAAPVSPMQLSLL